MCIFSECSCELPASLPARGWRQQPDLPERPAQPPVRAPGLTHPRCQGLADARAPECRWTDGKAGGAFGSWPRALPVQTEKLAQEREVTFLSPAVPELMSCHSETPRFHLPPSNTLSPGAWHPKLFKSQVLELSGSPLSHLPLYVIYKRVPPNDSLSPRSCP